MKKTFVLLLTAFCCLSLAGAVNLLPNPEFASRDGHFPDGWNGYRGKNGIAAYTTKDGIFKISGKTPLYAAYAGTSIKVEPGKSYYFSVEMRADLLTYSAMIGYSVMDGNRKRLVSSRPLLNKYSGPQKEWVKIGFPIPIGSLPQAKTLSVSMVVYNFSRKPAEDRAIYFRNPVLTYYNGQKTINPPRLRVAGGSSVMPDNPFPHNFTGFAQGTPYKLEKNGVGFLRFNSGTMPRQTVTVSVNAPPGVRTELYIWKRSAGTCVNVPRKNGKFVIDRSYDWLIWSNCLIFTADKTVAEKFDISMTFECGKKKIRFTVPVQQIPEYKNALLPEKRRYSSWQDFPVNRINTDDPQNTLAVKLKDYWKNSGWNEVKFFEIVRMVPYAYSDRVMKLRQAVDPSGAPVPLYCDSAMAAAGPEFFKKIFEKKSNYGRLKKAVRVTWDYEPYTKGPVTISCFCKECIRTFAKKNGLPETVTGTEILRKHKRAWVDFRCRQRAASVKTVVAGIKLVNPQARFGFCSMPFAPRNDREYEETYGIRSSLYDDFVDFFNTMNYARNLDFFRSLEREALELKSPKSVLVSNGWGRPDPASHRALQLFAAFFFADSEDTPGIAQGMFVSDGEQIREFRRYMDLLAKTEKRWQQGKIVKNTRKVFPGFNAAGNIYVLERKGISGTSWNLVVNNSIRETAFARLECSSGSVTDLVSGKVLPVKDSKVAVKLAPLSCALLEFSAQKKNVSSGVPDHEKEEKLAIEAYRKKTSSGSRYGMHFAVTPEKCIISTPVHSLELNLKNSGEGVWKLGKKKIASLIGRDVFMDKGVLFLSGKTITIEDVSINKNSIKVRFSYTITDAPYAGLVLRREYTLDRSKPEIDAYIEIVPQGGYRPFRLRTVNNFVMPGKSNPNAPVSEVLVGKIKDKNTFHISFVRKNAKFADGKPYFSGKKGAKKFYPLESSSFSIRPVGGKPEITVTAQKVDQLFVWRERNSGTLELIWPDAYPDNDPHKIATWKTLYKFKLKK